MRQVQTIAVIESEDCVVEGLQRLLGNDRFKLLNIWPSVRSAMASSSRDDLSAILIDITHRSEPFVDDVHRLRAHFPGARVILMAASWEKARVLDAMRSEVDGFLIQTIRYEVIIKILELILLGERIFPTRPGGESLIWNGTPTNTLSARELDVLRLVAKGNPNKVIARDLGLAEATVKVHVKAILQKASAQNRTELAVWAREVGLYLASVPALILANGDTVSEIALSLSVALSI